MRSNANAHIEAVIILKKVPANHSAYTEALCLLLREPLLKKGLLSNSLPKTFSFIFSHIGLALYYYRAFLF